MPIERQHFVPQGFLKGFSDPEHPNGKMIWKYDKRYDNPPRLVSIKSIAWSSFYYAQEKEDGEQDTDTLETAFAQTLDNEVPKIIQGIEAKPNKKVRLSDEEAGILAYFIGLSLTRVPSFRDGINELHTQIAQRTLAMSEMHELFISEGMKKHAIKAKSNEWVSLKPMIDVANIISESCLAKEWQFFIPHNDIKLITSDNPVHFSLPNSAEKIMAGPAHPAVEIIMNLRSDLALVCTPPKTGGNLNTYQLDKNNSRRFNVGTARAALNQIYASQKLVGLSKLAKKYANESQALIV